MMTIIKRLLKENINTLRNTKQTAPTYKKLEYILFLDEKRSNGCIQTFYAYNYAPVWRK